MRPGITGDADRFTGVPLVAQRRRFSVGSPRLSARLLRRGAGARPQPLPPVAIQLNQNQGAHQAGALAEVAWTWLVGTVAALAGAGVA